MRPKSEIGSAPLSLKDLRAMIGSEDYRKQFAAVLPKTLTPDRFVRIALTALLKTPKIAECTTASIFKCLLDCASLGLEPDGRRAHLIPYGNTCTLIIDYKGLAELAYRSGMVKSMHADKICMNDVFEYDRGEVLTHKIDFRQPRGPVFAYWARATMKDGTEQCAVMGREEVDAIRSRSRSATSGPWVTDYDEMAKKTVFRRLAKWIPLSPEIRDALDADDEEYQPSRASASIDMAALPAMDLTLESVTPGTDENRGHDHASGKPAAPNNLNDAALFEMGTPLPD